MAKVTLGRYAKEDENFIVRLEQCLIGQRKKARRDVVPKTGKSVQTYYQRIKDPSKMTVGELRVYVREAKMPKEDIIDFIYGKGE